MGKLCMRTAGHGAARALEIGCRHGRCLLRGGSWASGRRIGRNLDGVRVEGFRRRPAGSGRRGGPAVGGAELPPRQPRGPSGDPQVSEAGARAARGRLGGGARRARQAGGGGRCGPAAAWAGRRLRRHRGDGRLPGGGQAAPELLPGRRSAVPVDGRLPQGRAMAEAGRAVDPPPLAGAAADLRPGRRGPGRGRGPGAEPWGPAAIPGRHPAPSQGAVQGGGRDPGEADRLASPFRPRLAGLARRARGPGPHRGGRGPGRGLAPGGAGVSGGDRRRHGVPAQPARPALRSGRTPGAAADGRGLGGGRQRLRAACRRRPDPLS